MYSTVYYSVGCVIIDVAVVVRCAKNDTDSIDVEAKFFFYIKKISM